MNHEFGFCLLVVLVEATNNKGIKSVKSFTVTYKPNRVLAPEIVLIEFF